MKIVDTITEHGRKLSIEQLEIVLLFNRYPSLRREPDFQAQSLPKIKAQDQIQNLGLQKGRLFRKEKVNALN